MITILYKCCLYLSIFILYTIKAHSVVIQNKQNLLLRHRLYLFSLDFSDIYFSFITIFYFILNFLFSQSILENTWLYSFTNTSADLEVQLVQLNHCDGVYLQFLFTSPNSTKNQKAKHKVLWQQTRIDNLKYRHLRKTI